MGINYSNIAFYKIDVFVAMVWSCDGSIWGAHTIRFYLHIYQYVSEMHCFYQTKNVQYSANVVFFSFYPRN